MKVIPVIDILNGTVVHAVRGKRSQYQPLQSALCKSTDPLEVAKTFRKLGFSDLYVADLDAIIGCSTNFQLLKHIVDRTGFKLMVDAGVTYIEGARSLIESGISKLVIGTETLQSQSFVSEAVNVFGKDRVIVSLDLKGDKVLVSESFDGATDPMDLLSQFSRMGVSEIIVLDLTRVGSCEGVNTGFLKKILETMPMNVYVGGGVRDMKDLIDLKNLGVSGVLVATALHSGKTTVDELKQSKFL